MEQRREVLLLLKARRQLGLVTWRQIAVLGYARSVARRRVQLGEWARVVRGVYKVGAGPWTADVRELAALLAAGRGAVLSHQSAARRLGLTPGPAPAIQITLPAIRTIDPIVGAQLWRSRALSPRDVTTRGPFRLTTVARTVLDLAGVLDDGWLRAVVDSAIRQNRANLKPIVLILKEQGRGKKGSNRLRALLDEHTQGGEVSDSALESLAMQLCLAAGHRPLIHHHVYDAQRFIAEVDLSWPDLKLGVELDSWLWHSDRQAFRRDRARDRALVALDWTILRYLWTDVKSQQQLVIAELSAALLKRLSSWESRPTRTGTNGR